MKNHYSTILFNKGKSFLIAFSILALGAFTLQVNAATANNDVIMVRKNQAITFDVSTNDDLTGCSGTLSYSITSQATLGTASFATSTNPNMTYAPSRDVVGIDSLKYQNTCSVGGASSAAKIFALVVDDTNPHQYYTCSGNIRLSMFPMNISDFSYSVYTAETGGTALSTNQSIPLIPTPTSGTTYWVEAILKRSGLVSRNRISVTLGIVKNGVDVICNSTIATGCTVNGKLLGKQDFGTGTLAIATTTSLPIGSTTYNFVSNKQPSNGQYSLVKSSAGTNYLAWITNYNDHTGNGGYMMMVNADDTGDKFYSLTIPDLCAETRLTFSAWVGNLVNSNGYSSKANPSLRFDVRAGGPDGELVAQYYTGSIPKVAGSTVDKWKQYGFNFTNGDYTSLYFAIYNLETNTDGNDLLLDDIAVHLCMPPTDIIGVHSYCPDEPMDIKALYTDDGTFGTDYEIRWLYSTDPDALLSDWQLTGATGTNNNNAAIAGFYRAIVGKPSNFAGDYSCCSVSEPFQVFVSAPLMYWKRNTTNKNWNDPNNWEDLNGISLNTVPRSCTDVHIPGNAVYYPSLAPDTTILTEFFGVPQCHDIYFHFGSEVARTDLLTYHYAFAQYNFGYYDPSNTIINGDVSNNGNRFYSAAPMKRGQWYALSAPLKKIASGDFSVGGFPYTWQQSFKSSPNETGATGEWYTPKNTNSWDIGTQYNAISIWAGEYLPDELGEDIHTNLNSLMGIFEMPYFENTFISDLHRIHSYAGGISSFNYFYKVTGLPLAGTNGYPDYQAGTLARGQEAYRFIFDGNLVDNNGQMAYKIAVPAGVDVMIGNPFLSSMMFSKLYAMNSANMENYYRLFEGTVPNAYTFTLGQQDLIASFQAFFIKTKGTVGTNVDLYFPVSASVTRGVNTAHQLRSAPVSGLKGNTLQLTASNSKASSNVVVSLNNGIQEVDIPQLFMVNDQSSENSLQFYVKNKSGMKNAIQFENSENVELKLGIVSKSKAAGTIQITNAENINASSLLLTDLKTNKTINLLEVSSYDFVNDPAFSGERFVLKAEKLLAPTAITPVKGTFNISIIGREIRIQSSEIISEVSLINPQGVRINKAQALNSYYFTKEMQAAPGVYIVSVKLSNGEVKNTKVIIR